MSHYSELKKLNNPNVCIKNIMANVVCMLDGLIDASWADCRKAFNSIAFINKMKNFNPDSLS